jgi:hypothetical protein
VHACILLSNVRFNNIKQTDTDFSIKTVNVNRTEKPKVKVKISVVAVSSTSSLHTPPCQYRIKECMYISSQESKRLLTVAVVTASESDPHNSVKVTFIML